VQHVELVQRHPVDERPDETRRLVMTRRVEHQAAPREARRIVDGHRGNGRAARARRRHELPQRRGRVGEPGVGGGGEHDGPGLHLHAIGLGPARKLAHALEANRALAARGGMRAQRDAQAHRGELGEVRRHAPGAGVVAPDQQRRLARDGEFPAAARERRGVGDHDVRRGGECRQRLQCEPEGEGEGGASAHDEKRAERRSCPALKRGLYPWENTVSRTSSAPRSNTAGRCRRRRAAGRY